MADNPNTPAPGDGAADSGDVFQEDEEAKAVRERFTMAANRARAYAALSKDLQPGEEPFSWHRGRKRARGASGAPSTAPLVDDLPTEEDPRGPIGVQPTGFHLARGAVHLKIWHVAVLVGAATILVSVIALRLFGVRAEPRTSIAAPSTAEGASEMPPPVPAAISTAMERGEEANAARAPTAAGSRPAPPASSESTQAALSNPAASAESERTPLSRGQVDVVPPRSRRPDRARPTRDSVVPSSPHLPLPTPLPSAEAPSQQHDPSETYGFDRSHL